MAQHKTQEEQSLESSESTTTMTSPESDSESSSSCSSESVDLNTSALEENQIPLKERLTAFWSQVRHPESDLDGSKDYGFELGNGDEEDGDEGYSSDSSSQQEDGPYIEMNLGLGVLEHGHVNENDRNQPTLKETAASEVKSRKRKSSLSEGEGPDGHSSVMDNLTSLGGSSVKRRRKNVQILDEAA